MNAPPARILALRPDAPRISVLIPDDHSGSSSAIANHGHRGFDTGTPVGNFSKLLPCGPGRPIDLAATASILCPRETCEAVGPILDDVLQGDATWSRSALAGGHRLTFAPDAVVEHHHLETLRSLLSEGVRRGASSGRCGGSGSEPTPCGSP